MLIAIDQGRFAKATAGGLLSLQHGGQFARAGGMEESETPPAKKGKGGRKKKVRRGTAKSPEVDPKLPKNQRKRTRWHKSYTSRKGGEEGERRQDSDAGLQLS